MKNISHRTSVDFSSLIGVPYSEMNCWELCQRFYEKVFGVELKHYYEDRSIQDRPLDVNCLIYSSIGDFEKVEFPKFGDLILIKVRGIESHIAIYLDGGMMLHASKSVGSSMDRIAKWERLIVGYYRIKEKPV